MTNIYKTPESDLLDIQKMDMPREVFTCSLLLILEAICSLITNFTYSFNMPGTSITTFEGVFVISITIALLYYFIYLIKNRKKAITTWVTIFLILGVVFNFFEVFNLGINFSIGEISSLVGSLLLIPVLFLLKTNKMKQWLVI